MSLAAAFLATLVDEPDRSDAFTSVGGSIDHQGLFSLAVAVVTVVIAALELRALQRAESSAGNARQASPASAPASRWTPAVVLLAAAWGLAWAAFGDDSLQQFLAAAFVVGAIAGAAPHPAGAVVAAATTVVLPGVVGLPFVAAFVDGISFAEALLFSGMIGLLVAMPLLVGAALGGAAGGLTRHLRRRRHPGVAPA